MGRPRRAARPPWGQQGRSRGGAGRERPLVRWRHLDVPPEAEGGVRGALKTKQSKGVKRAIVQSEPLHPAKKCPALTLGAVGSRHERRQPPGCGRAAVPQVTGEKKPPKLQFCLMWRLQERKHRRLESGKLQPGSSCALGEVRSANKLRARL